MKIHILSDLHLEFSNYQPHGDADAADVIVLAGDIWKKDHGIQWARSTWPDKEIVYVAGNHEFYGTDMQQTRELIKAAAKNVGVHFLDMEEVVIHGVRFLGCTGWTDFELFGADMKLECMEMAARSLNDFRSIRHPDNGAGRFTPAMSVSEHRKCIQWLEMKLKREPFDGPTVVVTHHAPSFKSVVPCYQDDLLSACFASRLEHLMGFAELWFHGHMHDSLDYQIEGTRVICNPRGYARYEHACENSEFKPGLVIEVGSPEAVKEQSDVMRERNETIVQALLGLEAQFDHDYGLEYYDLGQLPEALRQAYWSDRNGSTQPDVRGAVDPVYTWDWEEWRTGMLYFCGHGNRKGSEP